MQSFGITLLTAFTGSGTNPVSNVAAGGLQMIEKLQIQQPTWYFIYFFLLIGSLAWVRINYGNILIQSFQASTNFQVAIRMFKDNSLLQKQLDYFLYIYYFLTMSFLLYYIELRIDMQPYELQGALLYFFNFAILAGIFLSRIFLINIAGFLFNREMILREYLYNIFIFNKLTGLVVLPLVFLLVYTKGTLQEAFFWITLFVLSCVIVMRLIRGFVFSYRKEVLIFYMFLYLCALELSPLVLLYRWLQGIL
jgi:Domain of unknown function (DUF4271)